MSGLPFRRKKLFKITRRTVRPIFLCCLTLYSASCGPRAAFDGDRPTSSASTPAFARHRDQGGRNETLCYVDGLRGRSATCLLYSSVRTRVALERLKSSCHFDLRQGRCPGFGHPHRRRLLRVCCKRPCRRHASEQADDVAAPPMLIVFCAVRSQRTCQFKYQ